MLFTPFPYSPSVAQVTCCTVPKWGAGGATWSWYLESLCFSSTMRQPGGLIFPPGLIWKCIASQWIGPVQTGCNGLDACGYEFLGVFAIGPGDVSVPAGSWCEDHQEVPQYWTGTADSTYTFGVPGVPVALYGGFTAFHNKVFVSQFCGDTITWQSHFVFSLFDSCLGSTCPELVYRALNSMS
jgi:hypothetical protein